MKMRRSAPDAVVVVTLFLLLSPGGNSLRAQSKTVNKQSQSWFSVNSVIKLSGHWALLADIHTRRNHFLADNNFYFARAGIQYSIDKNLSVALGYGHLWAYPATKDWHTVAHENRIYQQLQYSSAWKKVAVVQRIRNEQRWQQKIANDQFTGQHRFSNRLRYLLSLNIPVFKKKNLPAISVSDELLLQFGKEIVYNTFDQNRLFWGIREQLSPALSFDLGYMRVYQQKRSGYEYDLNHTFRLFVYYSPSFGKKSKK